MYFCGSSASYGFLAQELLSSSVSNTHTDREEAMFLLSLFALIVIWGITTLLCACLWPEWDR
jgi:hypothetical protein